MTLDEMTIGNDVVVSLAYRLRLDDGQSIDAASEEDPLTYLHGAGNIIPGLERELVGMGVGASKEVEVAPQDAYGEYDEEAYQVVPRSMFPADLALADGMGLRLIDQETGRPVEAYVSEVGDSEVVLDFNHPLAGETLYFQVKVVGLRAATDEELSHGHVHDGSHGH